MGCIKPLWLNDSKKQILAPCGQCPSCRATKAASWSTRLAHEMAYHDKSCFVTLTINDEHMPANGSLERRRLQLFFKRLRKSLNHKIKYYACGEYGSKTYRAHYHAIIFGLGVPDLKLIEDAWREDGTEIGHVDIGLCEMKSIHYVAGYVTKKIERMKDYEYIRLGFEPPFSLMSQGLGLQYACDHAKQIAQADSFNLNGLKAAIPRYYVNKLELDTSRFLDKTLERSRETLRELYANNYDKLEPWQRAVVEGSFDEDPRMALQNLKVYLGVHRQNERKYSSLKGLKKSGVF